MPAVDSTSYRPVMKEQYANRQEKPVKRRGNKRIVRYLLREGQKTVPRR